MNNILQIDASARVADSTSRELSQKLVSALRGADDQVTTLDLNQSLPFLNEVMVGAYFTPANERTAQQNDAIVKSDEIVQQLKQHNTLVIATPMYNFGPPASLKAWADLAARAGETFNYTRNGTIGLLENKRAFVIVATGGVKVNSPMDFLTPWLVQFLGFIGISDVQLVPADNKDQSADELIKQAVADQTVVA